jgi:hypothetical protein
MRLQDITNKSTLKAINNYNIDVSPFKDKEELRVYIKLNQSKLYSQKNKEYFRNYMRERYRATKDGKVHKYEKRQKRDVVECAVA